jgi:hypothetical protein
MLTTHIHAHRHPPPSRHKRFEVHDMRRVAVTCTDEARQLMARSRRQGRIFPQALSEFFGTLPAIESVEVSLEEDRLKIALKARDASLCHDFFIASDDLLQPSRNPREGFDAARTVDELLRLYRRDVLRED